MQNKCKKIIEKNNLNPNGNKSGHESQNKDLSKK